MTKRDLLKALEQFPMDAHVLLFCDCDLLHDAESVSDNNGNIQINMEGALPATQMLVDELAGVWS